MISACDEESEPPAEAQKHSRVYEFDEKYILRGITNLLKEKGYADPKVNAEKGRVETDFITAGNTRTKVEASVRKIGRRENEVTLVITTERDIKKVGWKPVRILGKEQYDRFFEEVEMQIYRELAKPEVKELR